MPKPLPSFKGFVIEEEEGSGKNPVYCLVFFPECRLICHVHYLLRRLRDCLQGSEEKRYICYKMCEHQSTSLDVFISPFFSSSFCEKEINSVCF